MATEEKLQKIQAISKMILDLKKSNIPNSKRTIQKLQQQINDILHD